MVSAAARVGYTVVDLKQLEREIAPAAVARPLLLAEQDVLVLAVGNGSLDVGPVRDIRAGGNVTVVEQAVHGLLEAHVDQFDGLREMSMPTHLRPSLSSATLVVAQPQKESRTMSPSLLLALMMRSRWARGFCVG